jgi:hypothetical protein
MNYEIHYNRLIESAQNRVLEDYTELHHIIPRCMGGTDKTTNLVDLTPEEHFVAHQLLTKMYPDNASLRYAANLMGNRNNKSYGWLKRGVSRSMKAANPMMNEESRKKMGESQRNKWLDPEYRKQQSEAHKGNIPSNVKWRNAPQGTAWCNQHKSYLPVEQFAKDKTRKNGLLVMCKECYNNSHYRKNRKWLRKSTL